VEELIHPKTPRIIAGAVVISPNIADGVTPSQAMDVPPEVAIPPTPQEVVVAPSSPFLEKSEPEKFLPQVRHPSALPANMGPAIIMPPYNQAFVAQSRRWSPDVADTVTTLLDRVFGKDLEIEAAFQRRCDDCDAEFDLDTEECPSCGGETREPDPEQEQLAKKWYEKCNDNGMSLEQFLRLLVDDGLTYDDAFMLFLKDYEGIEDIKVAKLSEIWRGIPERIRLIFDESYRRTGYVEDEKGDKHGFFTCLYHRGQINIDDKRLCECGSPMLPCIAVGLDVNGVPNRGYVEGELVHWSPENGSEGYGYSRIQTLQTPILTLAAMDRQQMLIYANDRPPKGVLAFVCDNATSLQDELKKQEQESIRNPNHIYKVALQKAQGQGGMQWVPITPTYQELENLGQRQELKRQIWSAYGVPPILMSDLSQAGGLNVEKEQLTVQGQSVETVHRGIHTIILPAIEKAIGLTDWHYRLQPVLEDDEKAIITRRMFNLQLRQIVEMAGGTIEVEDKEDWSFRIVEDPNFAEMGQMMGGMGSMGGQQGQGGMGGPGGQYGGQMYGGGDEAFGKTLAQLEKALGGELGFFGRMIKRFGEMLKNITENLDVYKTPEQQQAAIDEVVDYAVVEMASGAEQEMAKALLSGIELSGADPNEMGINIDAVRALTGASPVWGSFADMSDEMSRDIGEVVQQAFLKPQGADIRKITREMAVKVGGSRHQLRRIARTESNRITNLGREMGYQHRDPENEFVYKWVGGMDDRTCDAHKQLILETARNPQPMEVLKARVQELGKDQMGPGWEIQDWVIHPNQRGSILRVVL